MHRQNIQPEALAQRVVDGQVLQGVSQTLGYSCVPGDLPCPEWTQCVEKSRVGVDIA